MRKNQQQNSRKRAARLRRLRADRLKMLACGRMEWPAQIRQAMAEGASPRKMAATARSWQIRARRWRMPGLMRLALSLRNINPPRLQRWQTLPELPIRW